MKDEIYELALLRAHVKFELLKDADKIRDWVARRLRDKKALKERAEQFCEMTASEMEELSRKRIEALGL